MDAAPLVANQPAAKAERSAAESRRSELAPEASRPLVEWPMAKAKSATEGTLAAEPSAQRAETEEQTKSD